MSNPLRGEIGAAAGALGELVRSEGLTPQPGELEGRLGEAVPGAEEIQVDPLDWFALAAAAYGLRTSSLGAPVEDALRAMREGAPVATYRPSDVPGEPGRWVVLGAGRRGRIRLTVHGPGGARTERVLRRSDLAAELGLQPGERVRWLVAQPAAPAEGASSPHGGPTLHPLTRLLRLVRPDRGDIVSVALFAVAIGVLLLATPVAVQALVNFVALGGALPPLLVVALLLFLGLGFAAVLQAVQTWAVEILQRRIFVRMVADLAARLPRVSIEAQDKGYGPELVNRFFDVVTIQKVGSFLLLDGLAILLSVTVGLVVLAFYHPLLLAFDIVLLLVIAIIVLGPVRRGIRTAKEESNAKFAVAARLEELARTPTLFKSSGAQRWVFESLDRLAQEYVDRRRSHFRVVFVQVAAALALQVFASTALLGIGGLLVIRGSLTLGQLVAAELIVTLVVSSVAKMGKHLEGFYDLMAASDKVGKLLDLPLERGTGERHLLPEDAPGARLELSSVTWGRPGARPLGQPVTLTLRPGERLAVRGPSGSGKSTLLELLWGLRRPTHGSIRLDGRDLRELSLDSIRYTARLSTDVEVVEGTVRENVRLGRVFVSDDDIRAALERVGLAGDVARLPQGVDTPLTGRGRPLSDGQVRRLQVARAVAGHPRLLLVADSFVRLPRAERDQVLDVLAGDAPWTLVIVSNETDVLERCDRALDLPSGVVSDNPLEPSPVSA